MLAALPFAPESVPQDQVAPETRALINRLRFHAARCRASAHLDLYHACQVVDPNADEDLVACTLLRILGQALGSEPRWFRPGEGELSFDERWLAQLISAFADGDADSVTFLLARRIAAPKRRVVQTLVAQLANKL